MFPVMSCFIVSAMSWQAMFNFAVETLFPKFTIAIMYAF